MDGAEEFVLEGTFLQAAVSPDGKMIATTTKVGDVWIWDARFGTLAHSLSAGSAGKLCQWSPAQPGILALAGLDGVQIWDVLNAQAGALSSFALGQDVRCLCWSPQGDLLCLGFLSKVEIWDPWRPVMLVSLPISRYDYVSSVAWSPDGLTLACLAGYQRYDSKLVMWEVGRGAGEVYLTVVGEKPVSLSYLSPPGLLCWAPNSSMLAAATSGPSVAIWRADVETLPVALNLTGLIRAITSVSWSPDGSRILAGSEDGAIRVWRVGPPSIPVAETLGGPLPLSVVVFLVQYCVRFGRSVRR
jgi:WD40 repeat protein